MTEPNNYLYEKGTLLVAPGGGGALTPLAPPTEGQALKGSPNDDLGMVWVDTLPGEGDVVGPASATDGDIAQFDGITGKLLKDTGLKSTSFQPALVTGGAADTKGTFTLTLGASGDINTTAIAADSVVVITVDTLGTVTAPQAMLVTKTAGVKFVINSADNTDTSSGTWAILN